MEEYNDSENLYLMEVDGTTKGREVIIDGTNADDLARYVKHSCEPTCRADVWIVGEEAERDLSGNEEITWDYHAVHLTVKHSVQTASVTRASEPSDSTPGLLYL
ncbi:Histone-lysine N-methyltransferase, H3 lysine-36 specific [Cytospora mali]|uniref:Histone-lysine N-methyltransferase, H3 lysine-36 specific n=1 Tax=Cytospora mali TaxID=578113 RepID=A0A194VM76_CYTMA|nr:Histone-lysine N-methyltransferase, H3 lysine-36 specific [Valsa mali]